MMRMVLLVVMLSSPVVAFSSENDTHVGTWELRQYVSGKLAGNERAIHRLTLSEDGFYRNSATPNGPISVPYRTEKDPAQQGYSFFLIRPPGSDVYARIAVITVDKRGLIMKYDRLGRTLIYYRVSDEVDEKLLKTVPKKTVVIQKPNAEQDDGGKRE